MKPSPVLKDNGKLTKEPEEVLDRWYQHLSICDWI